MDVSAYMAKQLHDSWAFIKDMAFIFAQTLSQPLLPLMIIPGTVILAAIGQGTWSEALGYTIVTVTAFAIARWFLSRRLNQVHVFWIGLEDLYEDEDYDETLWGKMAWGNTSGEVTGDS